MPNNPWYPLLDKLQALTVQLDKLNRFNEEQDNKVKQEPAILRRQEDMRFFGPTGTPTAYHKPTVQPFREPAYQRAPIGAQVEQPSLLEDRRLPPTIGRAYGEERGALLDQPTRRITPQEAYQYQRAQKQSIYKSLRAYAPNASALMPPGTDVIEDALGPRGSGMNDPIMPWLMMGETHGAPRFVRTLAMRNWQLQQSAKYAGNVAGSFSDQISNADPGSLMGKMSGLTGPLDSIRGLSGLIQAHPAVALATSVAAGVGYKTIGKISDGLSNMRDIGQILGFRSAGGTSGWMGFSNPLSKLPTNPAVQEGLAFEMGKLSLEGRNPFGNFGVTSVTSGQAKSIMDALANQGWQMNPQGTPAGQPSGNAMSIAQNFMAPLMRQFPGLSAQDLSQFTPQLRYSAASTSDLVQALGDLGAQAKATQQTIGQTTSSIQQYTEATRGMGGSSIAGAATATGFTEETGMNPQLLGQAIQSPFIKGYAMSQGIMPWALGEQGATTNAMLGQGVNFLMGASRGMSMQTRRVLDRQTGQMQQVSGSEQQLDWVAQQLGWTRQQLQGYLQSEKSGVARRRVMEEIGQEGGTGNTFYNEVKAAGGLSGSQMTAAQKAQANKDWAKMIPDLQRAGLTQKQIGQLGGEGYKKRIADLQNMLTNQASAINKVHDTSQGTTNVNVQIGLTGYAAKLFKVSSQTSPAKKVINAGGTYNGASTYGQVYNRPEGDVSSPGGMYPATNAPETATPGGMYPTTPGPTQSPGGMYPTYGGSSTSNPAYGAG